mgnify:CR=1 FL=1
MINAINKIQCFLILKHYLSRLKTSFAFLPAEDYDWVALIVEKCVVVFALVEAPHKLVIVMYDTPFEQKENRHDKRNVKDYQENALTQINWLVM